MAAPGELEFYFDFISPYAYLAFDATREVARRHGRTIKWRPFRLGVAVVKVMGLKPIMETPLKSDYVRHDIARLAKVMGLPLAVQGPLPDPLPPALLFYDSPPENHESLGRALLQARWRDGRDIGQPAVLEAVTRETGFDATRVASALSDQSVRERLSAATRMAIERGVFGSPTVVAGDELFWGVDRLWLLDQFLGARGTYRPLVGLPSETSPGRIA